MQEKHVEFDQEHKPSIRATRKDHIIFVTVTLLYWTSMYIYVPILSPYVESLGASFTFVGVVLGSYGFVQIILRLPLGIISDRRRVRKPYIALGMLATAISCFCFALTGQLGWALAARAISGVAAATWVAFTVLYASYYVKSDATRAMGVISFITVVGQLVGMGLSGWLADEWGWHATFWVGGAIGVIGFFIAFAIKEPKEGVQRAPIQLKDISQVMRDSVLIKVSLLSILAHSILFITMFGFTPSYALTLDASKSDLSWLVFAFMIPHAITAYYTGKKIAPRFGAWNTVFVGFILSAVCTLAIPFTPNLGLLMATQALNGLAQGMHLPLLLGLSIQAIDHNKRATAMGFYQSVYAIGMFAGPFLAGWINNSAGLAGGFYFGGVIGVIAAGLAFYWSRDLVAGVGARSGAKAGARSDAGAGM